MIFKDLFFSTSRSKLPLLGVLAFILLSASPVRAESPLKFVVDNQTFVYNLEWTSIDQIAEGETLIGNILKTFFQYHFNKKLYVQGGALLQHPFGDDNRISETDPVISLNYNVMPGWKATAGTINRNHPLHDGIFWETLRFSDPIEQGFQLQGNTQHIKQDIWISWEERETTARREKFSIGNFTQARWNGFYADGQIYWVHLGGQQNGGPGVFNNLSIGLGGGYSFETEQQSWGFRGAGLDVHWLYQKDEPPGLATKENEDGWDIRTWVDLWGFNLFAHFWEGGGQNFNSRRGDITMPGIALAKGNPLYRAGNFQEIGLSRVQHLADSVSARLDLRQQFVADEMVEVYAVTVQWHEDFNLFEDYFRKQWKSDSTARREPRSRLQRRARSSRIRR